MRRRTVNLVVCGHCGWKFESDGNMFPREDTPSADVVVELGKNYGAVLCAKCGRYTVFAPTSSSFELARLKYMSKIPRSTSEYSRDSLP